MPFSNYPNGFTNGLTVRGLPILNSYPGQVFWVSSTTGGDGNNGTFDKPFATVDYAIGRCQASRGDIILVKAGHTETISAAGGVSQDVAGTAIIGLGVGSLRPTFNFTATTSTFLMSAANCSIKNCLFTGGIDAVVSPIVVSAADCTIESCEIRDVTGQVTNGILTTSGAARLKILDHIHLGDTAAGTVAAIAIVGGSNIEITIRKMDGNFSVGGIDVRTTATTNLFVHDVLYFRTRNSVDIFLVDTITGSTGQIGPNINLRLQDNAANITEAITGATFYVIDPVYVVNADNEKGLLINWTASADA